VTGVTGERDAFRNIEHEVVEDLSSRAGGDEEKCLSDFQELDQSMRNASG
jgi:hypothetical protein